MKTMKALSVRQPYANMIAYGKKTIEVRSWITTYRGPLLICASVTIDREARIPFFLRARDMFEPRGCAVCTTNLVGVRRLEQADATAAMFDPERWRPSDKYYAWVLENTRLLEEPFPVKGKLKLFDVEI